MKAIYEHIVPDSRHSVVYKHILGPSFDAPYHFHPEYELTFIIQGEGLRYVGTSVEEFKAGEVILLGPNLPHFWQSKSLNGATLVEAFVVQFSAATFHDAFFHLPEFENIKKLLESSRYGLFFFDNSRREWMQFQNKSPLEQFLVLCSYLQHLSQMPSRTLSILNPEYSLSNYRLQKVMNFLVSNYTNPISMEQIAEVADLSANAFCRFFKQHTNKTFTELIMEFRLKASCQLLIQSNKSVKHIAYEVGFQDIPYFHRVFKRKMGRSPLEYRKALHIHES